MERYRRLIVILLAVAVALPVVIKSRQSSDSRASAAFSVEAPERGYVRIDGDVTHPGMYPLSATKMTVGVMLMTMSLDTISVLEPAEIGTSPVRNGEALQVHIFDSGRAHVTRGSISAAERLVMGIPLDINAMNESDLDKVQGIGPALAKRIVQYRQNNGGRMSLQDLLLVEGIGAKKYDSLQKYF